MNTEPKPCPYCGAEFFTNTFNGERIWDCGTHTFNGCDNIQIDTECLSRAIRRETQKMADEAKQFVNQNRNNQ